VNAAPVGTASRLGSAMPSPYQPTTAPTLPRGALRTLSVAPSTVRTANPTPRAADTASTQPRSPLTRYSGAGAPSRTIPAANTPVVPHRRSSDGTSTWAATVAASMTAVTDPAAASEAPDRAAHAGSADRVRQKLVKPSRATSANLATAGSRHSGVRGESTTDADPVARIRH